MGGPMLQDTTTNLNLEVGSWVASVYDGKWYVAKVLEAEKSEGEYKLSFLSPGYTEEHVNSFKKPWSRDDILDVPKEDILQIVSQPSESGNGQRKCLKLSEVDLESVLQTFKNYI